MMCNTSLGMLIQPKEVVLTSQQRDALDFHLTFLVARQIYIYIS